MHLTDQNGKSVELERKLNHGGEGEVYSVKGHADAVAKIYYAHSPERTQKLQVMVGTPPADPTVNQGHVSICWPKALVFSRSRVCVGFLMHRLDYSRNVPVHQLYNPTDRQQVAPGFSWGYLLRTAANIASVVEAIHACRYVVGDLNESNFLVSDRALVTLVDCDSMQVPRGDRGEVFHCPVGKPDFTPPELQGADFRQSARTAASDNFALGVLIFLLLMEGIHPFSGLWIGSGDPPDLESRIRTGDSPYGSSSRCAPMPVALPLDFLPATVKSLVTRCFAYGHQDPSSRPSPNEWKEALCAIERNLRACKHNSRHVYPNHLSACPWCERTTALNGFDPFPLVSPQQPLKAKTFVPRTFRPAVPINLGVQGQIPPPTPPVHPLPPMVSQGWAKALGWIAGFLFLETAGPLIAALLRPSMAGFPDWAGWCILAVIWVDAVLLGVMVKRFLAKNGPTTGIATAAVGITLVAAVIVALVASGIQRPSPGQRGQTAKAATTLTVTETPIDAGRERTRDSLVAAIKSGQTLSGESREGLQVWPARLTFVNMDSSSGQFTGQIEWTSLNAATKLEGIVSGNSLSFTETEYIRRGNVQLGVSYNLNVVDGNKLEGSWSYQNRSGPAWFTLPASVLSNSSEQQIRSTGENSGGVVVSSQNDALAKSVIEIRTIPGDCEVFLDGKGYGESGADGAFVVHDVLPGTHQITVRKSGYQDLQSAVQAVVGQNTKFDAPLQSAIGKLTIQTLPAAEVFLDGSERGTADLHGYLAIYDVPIGAHEVAVRKSGYGDGRFAVELNPGETKNVPAVINWAGGYLTVHGSPPGTIISISGLEELSGDWSDNPCPAGTYTITASLKGMKAESKTVTLQPGQHATVEFNLLPDPGDGRNEVEVGRDSSTSGRSPSPPRNSSPPLAPAAGTPASQTLLASAYLHSHDLTQFQTAANEVLRQGGSVTIELMHEHSGLSGDSVHPATVTLTPTTIIYDPVNSSCKYSRFSAPLRSIEAVEVSNKAVEGKFIGVVVRHIMPGTYLLHLEVRDPSRSNDKVKLYLATSDSYTVKNGNNVNYLASRSNSTQVLGSVTNIIRQAIALKR
jgi:serine/threonine protein kinase